jgi:protein-L-isoaspartate(D-aspartate) O-methyltransferase
MGYYTAILAALVAPGGKVIAYEIEAALAEAAARNLAHLAHVEVRAADAVSGGVPEADIIYVNAGVVAPPLGWLEALKPGGRLVFPWRPTPRCRCRAAGRKAGPGLRRRTLLARLLHPLRRGIR